MRSSIWQPFYIHIRGYSFAWTFFQQRLLFFLLLSPSSIYCSRTHTHARTHSIDFYFPMRFPFFILCHGHNHFLNPARPLPSTRLRMPANFDHLIAADDGHFSFFGNFVQHPGFRAPITVKGKDARQSVGWFGSVCRFRRTPECGSVFVRFCIQYSRHHRSSSVRMSRLVLCTRIRIYPIKANTTLWLSMYAAVYQGDGLMHGVVCSLHGYKTIARTE